MLLVNPLLFKYTTRNTTGAMFLVLFDDQKQVTAFFSLLGLKKNLKPKLHLISLLFIVARKI